MAHVRGNNCFFGGFNCEFKAIEPCKLNVPSYAELSCFSSGNLCPDI